MKSDAFEKQPFEKVFSPISVPFHKCQIYKKKKGLLLPRGI